MWLFRWFFSCEFMVNMLLSFLYSVAGDSIKLIFYYRFWNNNLYAWVCEYSLLDGLFNILYNMLKHWKSLLKAIHFPIAHFMLLISTRIYYIYQLIVFKMIFFCSCFCRYSKAHRNLFTFYLFYSFYFSQSGKSHRIYYIHFSFISSTNWKIYRQHFHLNLHAYINRYLFIYIYMLHCICTFKYKNWMDLILIFFIMQIQIIYSSCALHFGNL